MSAQHTTGPWSFGPLDRLHDGITAAVDGQTGITSPEWTDLAVVFTNCEHPDDSEAGIANARLIAAAPDMLEALLDGEDAIASLAARLSSLGPDVSAQDAYDSFYSANLTEALAAIRAAIAKAEGRP